MRQGPYKNLVKSQRENLEPKTTQEDLAEHLRKRGFRVTGAYISQIEAGLKRIPYDLAIAICEELGFDKSKVTEIFLPINYTDSLETCHCTGTEN
jgi:transcriptional regulator with XRE-family HTH domain